MLALLSWTSAKLEDNDVMASATASLTDWMRQHPGDLRHLDCFAQCGVPHASSEPLDLPSLEPIF